VRCALHYTEELSSSHHKSSALDVLLVQSEDWHLLAVGKGIVHKCGAAVCTSQMQGPPYTPSARSAVLQAC